MGAHIALKADVILGATLGLIIPLQLPLDVANTDSNGGLNMAACAIALTALAVIYVAFMAPLGIFFYESDEDQALPLRLLWSIVFAGIALVVTLAFVFITYSFLGVFVAGGGRASVSVYFMAIYSTIGWVPFVFFAGHGLVFLPVGFISDFINRPRALRGQQATLKKDAIKKITEEFAQ